jgi:hypothetical protein
MLNSSEVSEYLAAFNTNPGCEGVVVTNIPTEPRKDVALAIYISLAGFMIITSVWYFYMRQYRRRLKIRSLNPIVLGSIGSAIIILVRAGYNFAGREHFMCSTNLGLMYLFFVFNLVPDNLQVTAFLVKQKYRQHVAVTGIAPGHTSRGHQTGSAMDSPSMGDRKKQLGSRELSYRLDGPVENGSSAAGDSSTHFADMVSPVRWAKGFWNYFLTLEESIQFQTGTSIQFHSSWRFKDVTYVTPLWELSYDIMVRISKICII